MTNPILGKWHKHRQAGACDAQLHLVNGVCFVTLSDTQHQISLKDAEISPRLGNVRRTLNFENLGTFITTDNNAIDALLKKHLQNNNYTHRLESSRKWMLVAIVITIAFVFSLFKWGVPFAGEKIAYIIPDKITKSISKNVMEFLDEHLLESSTLTTQKRQDIRQHFNQKLNKKSTYTLHFRAWNSNENFIANAFALPSGDIVITDELIKLAKNQDEIDAILLHEIAHIIYRHGLQSVVRVSFIATISAVVIGDINAIADVGIGLGSLLIETNYSRNHESEADLFAFKKMLALGIDPQVFIHIMQRISDDKEGNTQDKGLLDYFSSHPNTVERNKIAKKYSLCFQKKTSCDKEIVGN